MQYLNVRTHPEGAVLPREDQLAWKIATMAAHNQEADDDAVEMIGNRLIDNAAVAMAAAEGWSAADLLTFARQSDTQQPAAAQ